MKEQTLEEFIKVHAKETDDCYYYLNYSKEIQKSLNNIFKACWRFCLRSSQTLYMLNEALKPYDKDLLDIMK